MDCFFFNTLIMTLRRCSFSQNICSVNKVYRMIINKMNQQYENNSIQSIFNCIKQIIYQMKSALLLFIFIVICSSFTFRQTTFEKRSPSLTQRCLNVLPYQPYNINYNFYQSWYGKLGEKLTGTTYQFGHAFSRHLAVNGRCTDLQIKENKTVFFDENQFYRTLGKDTTVCDMSSSDLFNYRQDVIISAPSDYIKGIDCKTGQVQTFTKYYIQFKRAVQNSKPSQTVYMSSQYATLWTFYPKR